MPGLADADPSKWERTEDPWTFRSHPVPDSEPMVALEAQIASTVSEWGSRVQALVIACEDRLVDRLIDGVLAGCGVRAAIDEDFQFSATLDPSIPVGSVVWETPAWRVP